MENGVFVFSTFFKLKNIWLSARIIQKGEI